MLRESSPIRVEAFVLVQGQFYHLRLPSLEALGDITLEWCNLLSGCTIAMVVMKVLKAPSPGDTHRLRGVAFTVKATDVNYWVGKLVSDPKVTEAYLVTGIYDFVVFGDD
jgi:hypothetical protein